MTFIACFSSYVSSCSFFSRTRVVNISGSALLKPYTGHNTLYRSSIHYSIFVFTVFKFISFRLVLTNDFFGGHNAKECRLLTNSQIKSKTRGHFNLIKNLLLVLVCILSHIQIVSNGRLSCFRILRFGISCIEKNLKMKWKIEKNGNFEIWI